MIPVGRAGMCVANRCCILLCLLLVGCGVYRDDTTGTMRQIVAEHLGISYNDAKPDATLNDLGCDELDVVELIMEIENSFSVTITDNEFEVLGGMDGWGTISVLDLANLVRGKVAR